MRLVTAPGNIRTPGHPAGRSRPCSRATRTRSPGCEPAAELTALVGVGGLELDIGKRGFATGTAAILERADTGDLRRWVLVVPEG